MKDLRWVLQFFPLKDIMMASLIVHMMGSPLDDKMELHWDLHMETQMDLNQVCMKKLSWVIQFVPPKDIMMASLIVHFLLSHLDEKIGLYGDLLIEPQMKLK